MQTFPHSAATRLFPFLAYVLAGTFFCATKSAADEVRLEDGSLIRGKISRISSGTLTIQPVFAKGVFNIAMKDVENFSTDDAIFMSLASGATFHGTVVPGFGNTISISSINGIAAAGTPEVAELWRKGDLSPAELALKAKDRKWEFTIEAGLNAKNGTDDFVQALIGFNAVNSGQFDKLRLAANFRYSETNGDKSQDNLHLIADYEDKFYAPVQWYTRTDNGYDKMLRQNFFTTSAIGLGYGIIDEPNWSLNFRLGGAFRYEAYEQDAGIDDVSTPALDVELNHYFQADFGKIYNKINYGPSLNDFYGNYTIFHESYFETAYYADRVGIRIGMSNTYNSIVAEGNKNLESTFYVKLVFKIK